MKKGEGRQLQLIKNKIMQKIESGETLTADEQATLDEIEAKRAEMEAMKPLLDKERNGETLTADEQAELDAFKANMPKGKMFGPERGGKNGKMGFDGFGKRAGFAHLTDEEKTALESMSDDEKKAFFETYKTVFPGEKGPGSPGLRQPQKVQVEYLMADYVDTEKQVPPVTDKEIAAFYEDNKETLYKNNTIPDLPAGSTVPTAPELPAPAGPKTEKPAEAGKPGTEEKPAEKPVAAPAKTETPAKPESPAKPKADTKPEPESKPEPKTEKKIIHNFSDKNKR